MHPRNEINQAKPSASYSLAPIFELMKTQTKFIGILLTLTILPVAIHGYMAYSILRSSLQEERGINLQRLAGQTIDRIDQTIHDARTLGKSWADRDVMQKLINGDKDGKISSFLADLSKQNEILSSVHVVNDLGVIVASSESALVNQLYHDRDVYHRIKTGAGYVQDIHVNNQDSISTLTSCYPIKSRTNPTAVIGILCVDWRVDKLLMPVNVDLIKPALLMIVTKDGSAISSWGISGETDNKANLIKGGT
jgi:hypothetical protein